MENSKEKDKLIEALEEFWSGKLPNLYEREVELRVEDKLINEYHGPENSRKDIADADDDKEQRKWRSRYCRNG